MDNRESDSLILKSSNPENLDRGWMTKMINDQFSMINGDSLIEYG
jgi:hypothetical protein